MKGQKVFRKKDKTSRVWFDCDECKELFDEGTLFIRRVNSPERLQACKSHPPCTKKKLTGASSSFGLGSRHICWIHIHAMKLNVYMNEILQATSCNCFALAGNNASLSVVKSVKGFLS